MVGDMVSIMRKSENARLTTSRLDGVFSVLVEQKMFMTIPLPRTEMRPRTPMAKPRRACHRGFIGGNWYLNKSIPIIYSIQETGLRVMHTKHMAGEGIM